MAAEDAAERKPEAFEGAVLAEGFKGVLRAGGGKATGWRFERRDAQLIEFYQQDERRHQYFLQPLHSSVDSAPAAGETTA